MVWLPWFVPLPCKHGYVDSQFVEEMAFPVAIAHFIPLQLQGVDSPWMWHSVTPHNTAAPAGCPALFREECVPFGLPITKDLRTGWRKIMRHRDTTITVRTCHAELANHKCWGSLEELYNSAPKNIATHHLL